MAQALRVINWFTVAGGVGLLLLSLWPGFVVAYGMLRYYIPRRLAFAACQGIFERHVAAARRVGRGRWTGGWGSTASTSTPPTTAAACTSAPAQPVTASARTPSATGFAYRPNRQASPSGAAEYGVYRLHGDWYWFRASNDWH